MVSFIGAGPGDPELLTIKGKKIIDSADVILWSIHRYWQMQKRELLFTTVP